MIVPASTGWRLRSMWFATAGWCVVLAPLVGCRSVENPVSEAPPIPKVTVAEVTTREITDADEYTGRTEASDTVEIHSRVFGFLKSIDFKDGDYVKEGQVLFTIEPDEYQAIHQQSQARIGLNDAKLELAKANLARKEKIVKGGHITQEEYEEAIAAVKEAEAGRVAARADANRTVVDLNHTVVRAPFSGRIDRAYVSKGALLTGGQASGTALTKIVKDQPMYAYFDVDERSLLRYMKLRRGDNESAPGSLRESGIPCYLQLADEQDFKHEGHLDFASAEVNYSTGTAKLRGVFPNKNHELVSGMFVRIKIPVSNRYKALLIPERALATDQNIKYVYVVGANGEATRKVVELGVQRGDMRVIKSGLEAGDRVIVKGLQRVKPGQKVEAELEKSPGDSAAAPAPVEAPKADRPKADPAPKTVDTPRKVSPAAKKVDPRPEEAK